jgi:hypothetical protein
MWPVYSRALRETFVSTITEDEAAVVAAALGRVNDRYQLQDGAASNAGPPSE